MDIETYRNYCLSLPGTSESFPFNEQVLVFKVGNKMFALANVDHFISINLKCEPERAAELREHYEEIGPGYHMNKKHWNTVSVTGALTDNFILELIDHSYQLIYNSLPKKIRLGIAK